MTRNIFIGFIVSVILAGCVGTTEYPYKVNTRPYTVSGKTYYPMATANGFSEKGTASWYGPDFHGKKTASGETYNKYAHTAAHKTLPFGTKVYVTNLNNGLSTTVTINDRGPFKAGRIIDLSYSAAKDINMVGTGTAPVTIRAIGSSASTITPTSTTVRKQTSTVVQQPTVKTSGGYYVQVASFSVLDNANKVAQNLSASGYSQHVKSVDGQYKVWAGPYASHDQATSVRDKLRQTYSGAFVVSQ